MSEQSRKTVARGNAGTWSDEEDTTREEEVRLSKPHAPVLVASTVSGAAAGALAGAIVGPMGAAIGGFLGAAIGAAAGEALEEGREEHDGHDAALDAIIGVDGGDIGTRKPRPRVTCDSAGARCGSRPSRTPRLQRAAAAVPR